MTSSIFVKGKTEHQGRSYAWRTPIRHATALPQARPCRETPHPAGSPHRTILARISGVARENRLREAGNQGKVVLEVVS